MGLSRRVVAEAASPYVVDTWELERIEDQDVSVTVDQLLVLAVVLGTTPAHLLMPRPRQGMWEADPKAPVTLPGGQPRCPDDRRWAGSVWLWLGGSASLRPYKHRSPEGFPGAAITKVLDAGLWGTEADISAAFEWLGGEEDDCTSACWYDECQWD
ncbi:Uncharacterised protein [Mycobacteroides abscessus subsp. abscessus]|nr:Uncharacterised protein [Mycobacteroides abscessus subsp. abscessus]